MKAKFLLLLAVLFLSPVYSKAREKTSDAVRMEERMYNCLRKSLKKNYGSADAYIKLIEDLEEYDNLFVLAVDRKNVRKINQELFSSGLVYYFYDKRELDMMSERHKSLNPRAFGPLSIGHSGFLYNEMSLSNDTTVQQIVSSHKTIGATSPTVINKILISQKGETTGEQQVIERFIGVYLWPYLCYCANVDFSTGNPK